MTKTISFNDLRQLKDSLPDGTMHLIADRLNITVQTVRNYFGGANYEFGKNLGIHIEPGPDAHSGRHNRMFKIDILKNCLNSLALKQGFQSHSFFISMDRDRDKPPLYSRLHEH